MRSNQSRGEDRRPAGARHSRRFAVVFVAGLVAVVGPFLRVAHAAEATDGPTAAAWGAAWLDAQLEAGVPLETWGSPDWGTSLEAGLALAAVEGNDARLASLWQAVLDDREAVVTAAGQDVPGRLALVILLATAIGEDPSAVGVAPGADLVARLEATRTAAGADTGLYGPQDPTYDGAYRQGYSIAALVAAGATPGTGAVDWLLDQQCDDGSWMPYRSDLTAPCQFDAGAFVGPDTNSTAAAVSGLVAAGAGADSIDDALAWLDTVQEDDGGWPFFPADGSDPNSTALVVQALRAAEALDDPAFADRDATPLLALLGFQIGCDAPDAGAFTYPGSGGAPNALATAQAVSAAAGATLGISAPAATGPFEDPCAQIPPTTTTTVAPTTVAPTTVAPTTVVPPAPTTAPTTVVVVGVGDAGASAAGPVPVAGATAPRALAFTGSSASTVGALGGGLLLVGAALLLATRRSGRY